MKKGLVAVTFVVYLILVSAITVIPTQRPSLSGDPGGHVNLIPFRYNINCILLAHRKHHDLMPFCLRNIFGNIALFLPFGILLPAVSNRFQSVKRVMVAALCLSLTIETLQFFSRFIGSPRAFDIDDILLNLLGAGLGLILYRLFKGIQNRGEMGKRVMGKWESG